ncbi:MAG TPA: hypothetical protein DD385_05030 [Marinobacter sp.]|nr:hypothetical protein [Marinobacter sp.]
MMKTGKLMASLVAGVALSGSASVALAQQGYAGISLGQAEVKDFCDGLSGLSGVDCDDTALSGRLYAGGFFDEYLAFEAGYRYIDETSVEASESGVASLGFDASYHMFDSSLLIFTPEFGPVRLFAKAGLQFWRQDMDAQLTLGSDGIKGSEHESGLAFRTGAGATIDFTESFGLRLEWDYLQNVGDDVLDNLESDIHIFSVGPEFRF